MASGDPVLRSFESEIVSALGEVSFPAFVTDRQGRVRWINDSAIAFVGDIRARLIQSVVEPADRRGVEERISRKVMGVDNATEATVRMRNLAGETVCVDVGSVALRAADHHVLGVFGLAHPLGPVEPVHMPRHTLTPREQEVLQYLVEGASTEQMAELMGLTQATVRNHVKRLLRA